MVQINEIIAEELLEQFARIHKENYPSDHLSGALSLALLRKYYSYFSNSECRNFVEYDENGQALGFIVAGKNVGSKINEFKHENRMALLSFFIRTPGVFARLIVKKFAQGLQRTTVYTEADYLILSVVNSSFNRGGGSRLLATLIQDLPQAEYSKVGLYVSMTNFKAINFYFSKGFRIIATCKGQYYMEFNLDKV